MQQKWTIVIAIVLGIAAVALTNIYFQQREQLYRERERELEGAKVVEEEEELGRVLVAAKDISKGATVDYDMLTSKTVPVRFIQPGALRTKERAAGKTALVTIMQGEQILANKLATPGTSLTLAGKTPPGKRAFTIGLDPTSAVGGMLKPADHVDVLAIFAELPLALTLFQDVLILAVGQEMVAEEKEQKTRLRLTTTAAAKRTTGTVTLALSPQEVQVLIVAMEHGKIRLTLRPRMEVGKALPSADLSQLPPVLDLNTLLQFYIGRPAQARSVEVIRGLKKEVTPLPAKEIEQER